MVKTPAAVFTYQDQSILVTTDQLEALHLNAPLTQSDPN